jgi:hypothetical protein
MGSTLRNSALLCSAFSAVLCVSAVTASVTRFTAETQRTAENAERI